MKIHTYTWDSENRLLSVAPTTPAVGNKSLAYIYDAHHRRTIRSIQEWNGSVWSHVESIRFIYDGWNVIGEYTLTSTTETLTRELTWGTDLSGTLQGAGGVGGLLMVEEISTTTTAYHYQYDGNGNVTEITDASGNSAASYRYDAFGNTLVATGTYAATNRYRFSTKPLDNEISNAPLYYYGYRWYDPMTGRWPSRDPIGENGGINLYAFVGNNGLSKFDALGLQSYESIYPPSKCQKMLSEAGKNEKISALLDKFHMYCPLKLKCMCCDKDESIGEKTNGFYNPKTKETVICANAVKDQKEMEEVLYEELSHALQDCNAIYYPRFADPCEQCICKEVQAKFGAPHTMPEYPHQVEAYIQKLMMDSIASCSKQCAAKSPSELRSAASNALSKCRSRE